MSECGHDASCRHFFGYACNCTAKQNTGNPLTSASLRKRLLAYADKCEHATEPLSGVLVAVALRALATLSDSQDQEEGK